MRASGPKKIVLVDDMASVLMMVKEFLESSGFFVKAFDDPNAALHEVMTAGADVVISDFNMPSMDGIQLLAAIKATHPGMQCILMTGNIKELPEMSLKIVLVDKSHDFLDSLIREVYAGEYEETQD